MSAVLAFAPAAAAAPVPSHGPARVTACPPRCTVTATAPRRARLLAPMRPAKVNRSPGENEGAATIIGIGLVVIATLWGAFGWLTRKIAPRREDEVDGAGPATGEPRRVIPLRGGK